MYKLFIPGQINHRARFHYAAWVNYTVRDNYTVRAEPVEA